MMNPSPVRAVALFISLFLIFVSFAAADTGGYGVTPAQNGASPGSPQDPVPITFWDLSVREMIIAVCLSFFPVLIFPVEIFFFLKLLAILGYRKVVHNAVSYNQNRQMVLDTIMANPGEKFHDLERRTKMKEGTLKYHLLLLEAKRKIVSFGTGRSLRYFENNGRYSELEKKMMLRMQNPTTRRILEILASSPEVSRKDIAGIMGVAGPTVTWHTKRLSGDGLISTSKHGRGVRYTLSLAGANIFKRYFGQSVGMAAGTTASWEKPEK